MSKHDIPTIAHLCSDFRHIAINNNSNKEGDIGELSTS